LADEVTSRDESDVNGPVEWKRVEILFRRLGRILHMHVGGQVIRTTGEHPFYEYTKGWIEAAKLQEGDRLATLDGQWIAVEEAYDTGEFETVYNMRVADFLTYFVGCDEWGFSVWAHNAACSVAVEDGEHVLYDRETRKVLARGTEAEVRAFAKDAGHSVIDSTEARVQKVYRTMSEKEASRVEAAGGLVIRPSGSSELGITLKPEYLSDLGGRRGNAKIYAAGMEFEVKPGTFEALRDMGATHSSARDAFPHLPAYEKGMTVPQVKIERGGVQSILLGNSPEAVQFFNNNIVSMRRL
jgi:hypothetical protein